MLKRRNNYFPECIKIPDTATAAPHSHIFLGARHAQNERRTWIVIWLCAAMMVLEIVGGLLFGSIALVADGLHMSTHAGALLLAALAYLFARRHAEDPRFSFGTGKLGDLAGFTSAIILAMISLLILYEALHRQFSPVPIHFSAAIPIAFLGLAVNVVSAWVLSGGHDHDHGHSHGHHHHHSHDDAETRHIETDTGTLRLEIFEQNEPPRFRLHAGTAALPASPLIETIRPDGSVQAFAMVRRDAYFESVEEIPEPHEFTAVTNMRAAVVHVMADAAVSVRDMAARMRRLNEEQGDQLTDFHLWRLAPAISAPSSPSTRERPAAQTTTAGCSAVSGRSRISP